MQAEVYGPSESLALLDPWNLSLLSLILHESPELALKGRGSADLSCCLTHPQFCPSSPPASAIPCQDTSAYRFSFRTQSQGKHFGHLCPVRVDPYTPGTVTSEFLFAFDNIPLSHGFFIYLRGEQIPGASGIPRTERGMSLATVPSFFSPQAISLGRVFPDLASVQLELDWVRLPCYGAALGLEIFDHEAYVLIPILTLYQATWPVAWGPKLKTWLPVSTLPLTSYGTATEVPSSL